MKDHIPKVLGSDTELANFVLGMETSGGTGGPASKSLLREIEGLPIRAEPPEDRSAPGFTQGDWGRRFLPTCGGGAYIDCDHLELNTPEVLHPADYVASWHAMLRIAEEARVSAARKLRPGLSLEVMANCTDRKGNSFGNHTSIAITRQAWTNLFERKLHYMQWLASYQVTSLLFTGAGKVGSENDAPPADFQLSERADFFGQLTSLDTTIPNRGIVNSRDEALATPAWQNARLHCIFYDTNLSHTAMYLRAAVLQIILTMLEAGEVDLDLVLDDPVSALQTISRDLTFEAPVAISSGKLRTALELQFLFLERAARFIDEGRCEGIVPDAPAAIALWASTLELLRAKDMARLARRLDWALKLTILKRMMNQNPELDWTSPEVAYADLQYANINPRKGLYWACERAGCVDLIPSNERIEQLRWNPPEGTRAWTRAMLLRKADPGMVAAVDWDSITFRMQEVRSGNRWTCNRTLFMPDPLGFTKAEAARAFRPGYSLEKVLDALAPSTLAQPVGGSFYKN